MAGVDLATLLWIHEVGCLTLYMALGTRQSPSNNAVVDNQHMVLE